MLSVDNVKSNPLVYKCKQRLRFSLFLEQNKIIRISWQAKNFSSVEIFYIMLKI